MSRLKQRSTLLGISSCLFVVIGVLNGSVDPGTAAAQLSAAMGLIAVDA